MARRDVFTADEQRWRGMEILPPVSGTYDVRNSKDKIAFVAEWDSTNRKWLVSEKLAGTIDEWKFRSENPYVE